MKDLMKLAEESISYREPSKYSDKDRTKVIKHRVDDNFRSQLNGVHGSVIGGGIGLGLAMGQSKALSKAYQKLSPQLKKEIAKNVSKTGKKLSAKGELGKAVAKGVADPHLRRAIAWTGAAVTGAKAGYLPGKTIGDMAYLERKSRKELHREPTEEEYKRVSKFSNGGHNNPFATKYLDTPSAIIQSNKRKYKSMPKEASDKSDIVRKILRDKRLVNSGTVIGGVTGAITGDKTVNKLTPDEKQHKPLRRVTGALVGGTAGALLGNKYVDNALKARDNIIRTGKETSKAMSDLEDMVKEELSKRKRAAK